MTRPAPRKKRGRGLARHGTGLHLRKTCRAGAEPFARPAAADPVPRARPLGPVTQNPFKLTAKVPR